ncbi:MAG: hypothetical protein GVY02_01970 [Bacteroidetes bacterium]|jgi:tetratricopeptide (TPR) repeat protein|nr:hypothetical protein [Bacteroidota bacterium]
MTKQESNIRHQIHDFIEGNLSEEETDRLWAELLGRPEDLDYLQTMATLQKMGSEGQFDEIYDEEESNVLQLATETEEKSKQNIYQLAKPYLVAAAILLIGFAVLFNLMNDVQQPQQAEPIAMIEYEIERSAIDQDMFTATLQDAVSQATSGKLESAFNTLEELDSADLTANQRIELNMVRGAIEYNSDQFEEAFQTFNTVLEHSNENEITSLTLEKATWYLANTQLELGMTDQAKMNMQRVVEMDGSFSRVAQQKLERI